MALPLGLGRRVSLPQAAVGWIAGRRCGVGLGRDGIGPATSAKWHVPEELISVGNVRFPRPNGQSHYVLVSTRLTPTGHLGVRYSITSSICASSDGEIVRPSACAVLILSTVWNFVGCSTGRSPGFAPLMILST